MKKLIMIILLFSCKTEDPGKPSEYFVTEEEQSSDFYDSQEESQPSTAVDYSVPICPAHPEGAKVFPGSEDFFGSDEHSGCTAEHCIKDLEAEKRKRQQQKTIEDLKSELGY